MALTGFDVEEDGSGLGSLRGRLQRPDRVARLSSLGGAAVAAPAQEAVARRVQQPPAHPAREEELAVRPHHAAAAPAFIRRCPQTALR